MKNDPKHIAAARELRDRYLERFNSEAASLNVGKYEVGRELPSPPRAAAASNLLQAA